MSQIIGYKTRAKIASGQQIIKRSSQSRNVVIEIFYLCLEIFVILDGEVTRKLKEQVENIVLFNGYWSIFDGHRLMVNGYWSMIIG